MNSFCFAVQWSPLPSPLILACCLLHKPIFCEARNDFPQCSECCSDQNGAIPAMCSSLRCPQISAGRKQSRKRGCCTSRLLDHRFQLGDRTDVDFKSNQREPARSVSNTEVRCAQTRCARRARLQQTSAQCSQTNRFYSAKP